MRIGIDARLWNESGVGRYIRNLIEQLLIIDRNNSYFLFALSKDKEEIKYQILASRRSGSNIKKNWKLEIVDIRWHTIEEQLQFPSILNKENLDLVHFPYFSVPIFYNKPFVVTIHDLILHHFPTGEASTLPLPLYQLKLFGYKFIISQAAKKAKKIITVSNATRGEIIDHLNVDSEKIIVTYEGIEASSKLKAQSSKLWFDKLTIPSEVEGQFKVKSYFLYVGNAYPHKNLERLIEAFSSLCHPDPPAGGEGSPEALYSASWDSSSVSRRTQNDTKLILVGKEDYFYKRLKEKVRNMGLERSVLFYGEVSDEELASLYRNAKALIIPSLMEGFGLPALEAMANKCLVLASDIPAVRGICGDAAIYFNPYDNEDIASRMKALYSNDTYHYSEKIKKGFKRAKAFSWEKMARETLRVYESILPIDF